MTGLSIACSSSANATISSKRSRIRSAREALQRAVQLDVLAPGEVGMEPRAELEQRADPAGGRDPSLGRLDDPGDQPEQRRLAGAVPPDEPHGLAGGDAERDVAERPHLLRPRAAPRDERAPSACVSRARGRRIAARRRRPRSRPVSCALSRDGGELAAHDAREHVDEVRRGVRHLDPREREAELARRSAASTSRSQRISRWSETKPTGQATTSVTPCPASSPRWSRMSGPSHGSPVLRLALEGERPVAELPAIRDQTRKSRAARPRYVSPASRMRAGSEWAVKTTCALAARPAPRGRAAPAPRRSPARCPSGGRSASRPARRPRRRRAPSYFAIDIVDQCGASTSPTRRSSPPAIASSTAVAMRGSQCRIPVKHRQPERGLERCARRLRDGVQRRGRVRVVDPERAVPLDEVCRAAPAGRAGRPGCRRSTRARPRAGRASRTPSGSRRARSCRHRRRAPLADERGEPRQRPGSVLGEDAVAEVEDVARPAARARSSTSSASRSTTSQGAVSTAGSRFPWTARSGTSAQPVVERQAPVEADHVAARGGELVRGGATRPCRSGSSAASTAARIAALHGRDPLAVEARARASRPRSRRAGSRPRRRRPWRRRRPRTSRSSFAISASHVAGSESISALVRGSSRLGRPSTR